MAPPRTAARHCPRLSPRPGDTSVRSPTPISDRSCAGVSIGRCGASGARRPRRRTFSPASGVEIRRAMDRFDMRVRFVGKHGHDTLHALKEVCARAGFGVGVVSDAKAADCLICEVGLQEPNTHDLICPAGHPIILLIPPTGGHVVTRILRWPRPCLDRIAGIVIEHRGWEHDLERTLQRVRSLDLTKDSVLAIQGCLAGRSECLRRVIDTMVEQPGRLTTLQGTLKAASISRREYVCETRRHGFNPPLQFIRAVRVVTAYMMLRRGGTVCEISRRCGYGSEDTLRHHFRSVLDLTPTQAAKKELFQLLDAIRRSPSSAPVQMQRTAAPAGVSLSRATAIDKTPSRSEGAILHSQPNPSNVEAEYCSPPRSQTNPSE
jgi:AraC-like DNA-binding protein